MKITILGLSVRVIKSFVWCTLYSLALWWVRKFAESVYMSICPVQPCLIETLSSLNQTNRDCVQVSWLPSQLSKLCVVSPLHTCLLILSYMFTHTVSCYVGVLTLLYSIHNTLLWTGLYRLFYSHEHTLFVCVMLMCDSRLVHWQSL